MRMARTWSRSINIENDINIETRVVVPRFATAFSTALSILTFNRISRARDGGKTYNDLFRSVRLEWRDISYRADKKRPPTESAKTLRWRRRISRDTKWIKSIKTRYNFRKIAETRSAGCSTSGWQSERSFPYISHGRRPLSLCLSVSLSCRARGAASSCVTNARLLVIK